jgi:2-polyprenyl-3-methyl-5-hydroxy-6-metoxy-1,4-benzoquinol methylase
MPAVKRSRSLSEATRSKLYNRYVSTDVRLAVALGDRPAARWAYFSKYFLPLMPSDMSAPIVDIGCGSGSLLGFLRERGYHNLAGIDRSPEQVEIARQANLGSIVSEGEALAFLQERANAYQCIVSIDFVEHLDRAEAMTFFELGHKALRKNGTLVLQTINGASPFFGNYFYGDITHETVFTARSLDQAMSVAGFREMHVRGVDPVPRGLRSTLRYAGWQLIKALFVIGLTIETGVRRGNVVSQNLILVARA